MPPACWYAMTAGLVLRRARSLSLALALALSCSVGDVALQDVCSIGDLDTVPGECLGLAQHGRRGASSLVSVVQCHVDA